MTGAFLTILSTGADKMAHTDPHGWTLSLISVSVVFCALVILYGVYSLIGKINMKAEGKSGGETVESAGKAVPDSGKAEDDDAGKAAIALALHLYLSETVHDAEPGIVTIRRVRSAWNDNSLNFRKPLDR